MTPPLQRGDFVALTADRKCDVPAMVTLASANGQSIIVMFDDMIGGFVQVMPLSEQVDGSWAALNGMPVTVRRLTREEVEATRDDRA